MAEDVKDKINASLNNKPEKAASNSIAVKVSEKLKEHGGAAVESKLIDALYDREIEKRSSAMIKAVDDLDKLEKAYKKLGADLVTYDEKGAKTSEAYSKARVDERQKAHGRIEKWTKAINKALTEKDYGDVYNLGSIEDKSSGGDKTG